MPFLPPCCCHWLVDCCVPPPLPLFPLTLPIPAPLPLLAADVIGDGGNCDKHFIVKEVAAVATAAREIFLRGGVQNVSLVKVIF